MGRRRGPTLGTGGDRGDGRRHGHRRRFGRQRFQRRRPAPRQCRSPRLGSARDRLRRHQPAPHRRLKSSGTTTPASRPAKAPAAASRRSSSRCRRGKPARRTAPADWSPTSRPTPIRIPATKLSWRGNTEIFGGTSAVAPLYAGLFAAFGEKLGFVTPELYLKFLDLLRRYRQGGQRRLSGAHWAGSMHGAGIAERRAVDGATHSSRRDADATAEGVE